MRKKVLLGMSGGLDSTIAAVILKQQGFDVEGVFMKTWDETHFTRCKTKSACYGPEDDEIEEVKNICRQLGIVIHFVDARQEFRNRVLDYFKNEYIAGRTPNPCVVCNRFIKFQFIIQEMERQGIDFNFFATGHYARVEYDSGNRRYILKKGIDRQKDQSYFLFLLTQDQLSRVIFPVGILTKQQVRQIATEYGLKVAEKKESQDFISGDRFFLFEKQEKGEIVDKSGKILGTHRGIIYYTIGQRRNLGISARKPLYVVEIQAEKNRLVVGEEKDLYRSSLLATDVNLVSIDKIECPMKVKTKIRYKHKEAPSEVFPVDEKNIRIVFDTPQRAITPGQAAVFYKEDILIGGGFIKQE